jgi:hypothetical protein
MATTFNKVQEWIKEAKRENRRAKKNTEKVTHIISVCDSFSYEDYPVFVHANQNLEDIKAKYQGQNMQRINEVIEIIKQKK